MEEMKDQEQSNVVVKDNYIKPYAIVKLGEVNAKAIADGYNSNSAEEKLKAVIEIAKLEELAEGTKVFFIGDIMTRPKKERIAIANKIYLLLELPDASQVEAEEV